MRRLVLGLLVPFSLSGQDDVSDHDGRLSFTRVRYGSGRGRGGGSWAHDYPRADEQLAQILAHLTTIRPRMEKSAGFLLFDDFEGRAQCDNMALQMARVLPGHRFIAIDVRHPIFHSFFEMKRFDFPHPLVDVTPSYFAMFEDNDPAQRIVVLVNYNNDLAEYWEWSSTGMFSVASTNEAYKSGSITSCTA